LQEKQYTNRNLLQSNLPLSYTLTAGINEVSAIKIGRNSLWLNGGNFSNIDNFISSIKTISRNNKIIIRGCNKSTSKKLNKNGFNEILFAKEAIIELDKNISITKKLLRRISSLLKRGNVKEIVFSDENTEIFNEFLKTTFHWGKPQLRNLFLDRFSESTRLFVYEISPNKWEGAILVSQNSKSKMQGEQFFRKKIGMNGVMDTLVYSICHILENEGYAEFSLGEVPFTISENTSFFSKANFLNLIGSKIKFAYNYKGLYNFKNKFVTRWDDIFICTNNRWLFLDLLRIAKKSNLLALALYKIFN